MNQTEGRINPKLYGVKHPKPKSGSDSKNIGKKFPKIFDP